MSIRRDNLIPVLFALASSQAFADSVQVNTGDDENGLNGNACSIREAVAYIKQKNIISAGLVPITKSITDSQSALKNLNDLRTVKLAEKVGATGDKLKLIMQQLTDIDRRIAAINAQIAVLNTAKATIDDQILALQISGCKPYTPGGEDIILLSRDVAEFEVTRGEIVIDGNITIERDDISGNQSNLDSSANDNVPRSKIRVSGVTPSRMFTFHDGTTSNKTIKLINLELQGCAAKDNSLICADKGGVIYNHESLSLQNSVISGGRASILGGAIYNRSDIPPDPNAPLPPADALGQGLLSVTESTFSNNTAPTGAAVYSDYLDMSIAQSLFNANTATNANGSILQIGLSKTYVNSVPFQRIVENDTFAKNNGVAIGAWALPSISNALKFRNLTIVENTAGFDFNGIDLFLNNSIIAGNGVNDCLNAPVVTPGNFHHNFIGASCPQNGLGNQNYDPPASNAATDPKAANRLIADLQNGKCASPPAPGLLCPLGNYGGKTLSYKPRLLSGYLSINESPIVNKGDQPNSGTIGTNCSSLDQRGTARLLCDIGSVELITQNTVTQGLDTHVGDVLRINLLEKIGDGELMPGSWCDSNNVPNHIPGIDGCIVISTPPQKGALTYDNTTHEIIYTPFVGYHGVDRFTYQMTTTLSRFSDAVNDQILAVNVTIAAEPTDSMKSKSFAGATGLLALSGLAGLVFLRRKAAREQ